MTELIDLHTKIDSFLTYCKSQLKLQDKRFEITGTEHSTIRNLFLNSNSYGQIIFSNDTVYYAKANTDSVYGYDNVVTHLCKMFGIETFVLQNNNVDIWHAISRLSDSIELLVTRTRHPA